MTPGTRLVIPHARIRRLVVDMPIRLEDADVRNCVRVRCASDRWTPELIAKAEDYAVAYYRRRTEGVKHA